MLQVRSYSWLKVGPRGPDPWLWLGGRQRKWKACGKPSAPLPPELLRAQPAPGHKAGRADSRALAVARQSRRCSCVVLRPQRPPVSKLPNGRLPGQKLWWQARVSPSSACRLRSPPALRSRSVQRSSRESRSRAGGGLPDAAHRVGDIVPQERCCLEFACFQLPITEVAISSAVFEQSIGSVLLHVFLLRRMTGRMLKEYVLQCWVGCDEPHAAGPGC